MSVKKGLIFLCFFSVFGISIASADVQVVEGNDIENCETVVTHTLASETKIEYKKMSEGVFRQVYRSLARHNLKNFPRDINRKPAHFTEEAHKTLKELWIATHQYFSLTEKMLGQFSVCSDGVSLSEVKSSFYQNDLDILRKWQDKLSEIFNLTDLMSDYETEASKMKDEIIQNKIKERIYIDKKLRKRKR